MPVERSSYVLVIEDDYDVRSALRTILEQEGYAVVDAENGQVALDYLGTHAPPCLILLDLMMPVMDGWTFKRVLDADLILRSIPVIVMTAARFGTVSNLNPFAFLPKPLDLDQLIDAVARVC